MELQSQGYRSAGPQFRGATDANNNMIGNNVRGSHGSELQSQQKQEANMENTH